MPTPSKQQQQQRAPASSLLLPTSTSTAAATTTSTAAETTAACFEASEAAADNETRFLFSLGDAALKNGHAVSADSTTTTTTTATAVVNKARLDTMTVSSGLQSSEDSEMVTVDLNAAADASKDVGVNSKDNWTCSDMVEDEEEEDDGGRLSSEEPEAINLCSKDLQQQPPMTAFPASDVPMMSAKMRLKKQRLEAAIWASSNDGLHKLAEAAERKQVSP